MTGCLKHCVGSCHAIDFDLLHTTCYHHTISTVCGEHREMFGNIHYSLIKCGKFTVLRQFDTVVKKLADISRSKIKVSLHIAVIHNRHIICQVADDR